MTPLRARIRLLRNYQPVEGPQDALSELRKQLAAVPALEAVELTSDGGSTVLAFVPAKNQRQKDQFKDLLGKTIRGWTVIEDGSYRVPSTF